MLYISVNCTYMYKAIVCVQIYYISYRDIPTVGVIYSTVSVQLLINI